MPPPTVTIDVVKQFGSGNNTMSFGGIRAATAEATDVLRSGRSATLFFGPGTFSIDMAGPLFNLTDMAAPEGGRFTIAGAGMLQTTLNLTTHGHDCIHSQHGTRGFTLRDITFARPMLTTTQGTIVAADSKTVTLRLDGGYPAPDQLLVDRIPRLQSEQGLFIRRYRRADAGSAAEVVTPSSCVNSTCAVWPPTMNPQLHFTCGGDGERCPNISSPRPGVWKLHVASWSPVDSDAHELARYQSDAESSTVMVGVKIKHGGQSYNIRDAHGVTFDSVRWLGHSRGILQNCDDVVLQHTRVDRSGGDEQALATPGGGPQVAVCNNLTVFNHTAVGTGDDALGLFDIAAGSVRSCNIRDSFCRGILLCNVSDEFAASVDDPESGNVVVRSPIYRPDPVSCSSISALPAHGLPIPRPPAPPPPPLPTGARPGMDPVLTR